MSKRTDALLAKLDSIGWQPGLAAHSYERICSIGLRGDSETLAAIICELALDCQPITLRGLFYRVVSTGFLPSTDKEHYDRVGRLVTRLRRAGVLPYRWIVDSLRSTIKPSSWSGLGDFSDTVREAYRKDFWAHLDCYVHVFCEKDAIAGVLAPVTREFDVRLSPVRGYCSESFAFEVGEQWASIEKPIFAYYFGDFDPSGFDIERDLIAKLQKQSGRDFTWQRLSVLPSDFADFKLVPLAPKKADKRYQKFIDEHGLQCAEVDAIDPNELRRRVRESIERWIPQDEWQRLLHIESLERETFLSAISSIGGN